MDSNRESPSIQAIDHKSVHQICSGQVVLDLATAVKELVENGLDAGAENIEIKLKEFGKEFIEVSDNGSGIEAKDFGALALKHYTSKLKEFNDLTFVDTFGFRGEALSSLAALSDICITTKHKCTDVGTKLEFDHDGKLVRQTAIARPLGTSITVENLFSTLPVRYKEFQRNYKKEFAKLIHVLHAYSLVNSNVRFTCVNIVGKKRQVFLSTNGKDNMLDIVSSIFGSKQAQSILPITQVDISASDLENFDIQRNVFEEYGNLFVLSGYISKVVHGCGRSSPDRQFFFINKRPCDFQKLSRIINEVYHSFNRHQYPCIILDISLNKRFVDVNVTPNKRLILIHQEKILFALIKNTLHTMFEKCATFYEVQSPKLLQNKSINNVPLNDLEVSYEGSMEILSHHSTPNGIKKPKAQTSPLERFRSRFDKSESCKPTPPKQHTLTKFFTSMDKKRKLDTVEEVEEQLYKKSINNGNKSDMIVEKQNEYCTVVSPITENLSKVKKFQKDTNDVELHANYLNITVNPKIYVQQADGGYDEMCCDGDLNKQKILRKKIVVEFNLKKLIQNFNACKEKKSLANNHKCGEISSFRAKIAVNDNKAAENELTKHVSKNMFRDMKILGQFNLGFIISKLKDDLFIIDQHAADEKFNFESLQLKHCLKGQKLIQPLEMELTIVNKGVLIESMEIFKNNGFDFEISENDDNETIVKLTKVPICRNWTFGVTDVEELIFMLTDSPGVMCRPSRVRLMFASRACRTSVMVGTPLSVKAMKTLVEHMSEIDHPWNCPHGRPTMRHLLNLRRINICD